MLKTKLITTQDKVYCGKICGENRGLYKKSTRSCGEFCMHWTTDILIIFRFLSKFRDYLLTILFKMCKKGTAKRNDINKTSVGSTRLPAYFGLFLGKLDQYKNLTTQICWFLWGRSLTGCAAKQWPNLMSMDRVWGSRKSSSSTIVSSGSGILRRASSSIFYI